MAQRPRQLEQGLGTAFRRHEHAVCSNQLKNGHDLPAAREVIRGDGDHRVVEAHPLPVRQVVDIQLRGHGDTHTLTARDDLDVTGRGECSHERGQSLRRARHVGQLALQPNQLGARCRQRGGESAVLFLQRYQASFEGLTGFDLTHRLLPHVPPAPTCRPVRRRRGEPCAPSSQS